MCLKLFTFLQIYGGYQRFNPRCSASCGVDGDHGRGQPRNVLFSAAKAAILSSNALRVAAALSARAVSAARIAASLREPRFGRH
jgi:hypothetical protein